jgi:hypothetical protein
MCFPYRYWCDAPPANCGRGSAGCVSRVVAGRPSGAPRRAGHPRKKADRGEGPLYAPAAIAHTFRGTHGARVTRAKRLSVQDRAYGHVRLQPSTLAGSWPVRQLHRETGG